MKLNLRWRVVLSLILFLFIGYFWVTWSVQQGANLVASHFGYYGNTCSLDIWQHFGYSCELADFPGAAGWVLLISVGLLFLLLCVFMARMILRPTRRLAEVVDRLGPQNPGERTTEIGRDELGRLGHAVNAMLDRAAESYESQRRFAANASHELRTPLALQRTLIEVSMSGSPTPEQLDLLAHQLLSANKRNEALIEGLLVLAESDRGLASSTPQQLDEIARSTIANYRALADRAGVSIFEELTPVTVTGEGVLLERLIANLVHNGIKYNDRGGRIDVRVGPDRRVSISNSGDRVPEEALPSLFEPFRRLSGERIDHSGGAGLGLTIARSIVVAHNASIRAISRPEGGLEVTVTFP